MPSIDITQKTVIRVLAEAVPGSPRVEITDTRARGLVLRAGPGGATWQFRYKVNGKSVRLPLGPVSQWTIAQARDIAGAATTKIKSVGGFPDAEWLKKYLETVGLAEPERPSAQPVTVARTWRLEQGRDHWLAEIKRTRRPSTHQDYSDMLNHRELKAIQGRPLAGITRQEMSALIARVHASGTESTAEHLVRVVRPFWKWLARDGQIAKSGVKPGIMDGLAAPERTLDEKPVSKYVPEMAELGRIIAIARSGAIDPVIGNAIEMTVWTIQRRRSVVEAEVYQFAHKPDGKGIWIIPPASRKSRSKSGAVKRPHVIPLPKPVMDCFLRAEQIAYRKKSPYLFPQLRGGKKSDVENDGVLAHLSGSIVTHTLSWLPGVKATPHDIRRAFATHGEVSLALIRAETQEILDHSAGAKDVTGQHYALHDATHRTWDIMNKWVDALQPYIDQAIAELEPVEELKAAIADARYREETHGADEGMAVAAE